MTVEPDFTALNELLAQDDPAFDAAELHGSLCAQLSVDGDTGFETWLERVAAGAGKPTSLDASAREALFELYQWTLGYLDDPQLGFQLFLPDDSDSLPSRVEALVNWSSGYLSGLGLAGMDEGAHLPEEVREFMDDLAEISRADFESERRGEQEEVAFMELVEYARVGVMLVFEALRGPAEDESIH